MMEEYVHAMTKENYILQHFQRDERPFKIRKKINKKKGKLYNRTKKKKKKNG